MRTRERLRRRRRIAPEVHALVALVRRRGWTWQDAARRFGVHRVSLAYWRSGYRRPVGLYLLTLRRLLARWKRIEARERAARAVKERSG